MLFYSGRYEVNLSSLCTPPKDMMCRPVNQAWVKSIKRKLNYEPGLNVTTLYCLLDPETITDPAQFKPELLETAVIYTIGGNHLRTAVKQLAEDGGLQERMRRLDADVFVGLSPLECLRLGNVHNVKARCMPLGFADAATQARDLLLKMSERGDEEDPPETVPATYRETFKHQIGSDDKVKFQ